MIHLVCEECGEFAAVSPKPDLILSELADEHILENHSPGIAFRRDEEDE